MDLKIDIGGVIETFSFEQAEVLVGASSDCDIVLSYEGIGEEHLKIQLIETFYQVQDLGSGSETFIDGSLLSSGEIANVGASSQIELGGVFIEIDMPSELKKDIFQFETDSELEIDNEESDNTQSIDHLLEALNNEKNSSPQNLDDIEKDLNLNENLDNEPEADGEEPEEDFKPDLFSGVQDSSIQNEDAIPSRDTSEVEATVIEKTIPRRRKHTAIKEEKPKETSRTLFSLVLVFVSVGGFFLYKELSGPKESKSTASSSSSLRLATTFSQDLQEGQIIFEEFVIRDSCLSPSLKELCQKTTKQFGGTKTWKVFERGETVVIGIEDTDFAQHIDRMLSPLELSEDQLSQIIQSSYKDFFSYEQFLNNNQLPPTAKFTYTRNENNELFLMLSYLFGTDLVFPENFKNVFIFVYSNFLGEIVPKEFLKVETVNFYRENKLKNSILPNLRAAWKYHLTENFEMIVSSLGGSSKITYDPQLAENSLLLATRKLIIGNFNKKKCLRPELVFVCLSIEQDNIAQDSIPQEGPISLFEGAVSSNGKILLYMDLDKITTYFSSQVYPEYGPKDRANLIKALGRTTLDEKKELQKNGYVSKMEEEKYLVELLLAGFYRSSFHKELLGLSGYTSISIIGFNKNAEGNEVIRNVVDVSLSHLRTVKAEKVAEKHVFLVRSRISIFKKILKEVNIPTVF